MVGLWGSRPNDGPSLMAVNLRTGTLGQATVCHSGRQIDHARQQVGCQVIAVVPIVYCSRNKLRITKVTLAGRSPSRRMKYENHSPPNGT